MRPPTTLTPRRAAPTRHSPAPSQVRLTGRAFNRTILEVIRDAGQPMAVREIAHVLAQRPGRPLDKREVGLVVARVRNAMPRLSDRLDGSQRERTTHWTTKKTNGLT